MATVGQELWILLKASMEDIINQNHNNMQITTVSPISRFDYYNVNNSIYHAGINQGLPRHEHTFAHTTVCVQGRIVVRKQNKEIIIGMNDNPLLLTANEWHEIEALEPNTIFINQFPKGLEE